MNNRINIFAIYIVIIIGIISLFGCSDTKVSMEKDSLSTNVVSNNAISVDSVSNNVSFEDTISENEVDEKATVQYFINLENEGNITLEDYLVWSQLLEQEDNDTAARKILWRAYRMYPETRTFDTLSKFVMDIDIEDATYNQKLELINSFKDVFLQENFNLDIITTSEWEEEYWLGDGFVNSNIRIDTNDEVIQVSSSTFSTCILCINEDKSFEYYVIENNNALYIKGSYQNNNQGSSLLYDGNVFMKTYKENELYKEIECTVSDELIVGKLDIIYNGTTYSGQFDENGRTLEEQPKKAEGTVYAYSSNEKKYLYSDDKELIANLEFIGLPEINIWE